MIDFLSFVFVELIRFFHEALQLFSLLFSFKFSVSLALLIFILYLNEGKIIHFL